MNARTRLSCVTSCFAIIRRCGFINPIIVGENDNVHCRSLDFERLKNRRSKEKRHGQKAKNGKGHRAKGR
jgi:hypothetical protein